MSISRWPSLGVVAMSGDKRKTQRPMTHFFANLFSFRKKVDSDKGQKKASAASAAEVKAEFDQVLFDFSTYKGIVIGRSSKWRE